MSDNRTNYGAWAGVLTLGRQVHRLEITPITISQCHEKIHTSMGRLGDKHIRRGSRQTRRHVNL